MIPCSASWIGSYIGQGWLFLRLDLYDDESGLLTMGEP